MPRLSFTLRDVFWLTLVVGMGVGWCLTWQREQIAAERRIRADWQLRVRQSIRGQANIEVRGDDLIVITTAEGVAHVTPHGMTSFSKDGSKVTLVNKNRYDFPPARQQRPVGQP